MALANRRRGAEMCVTPIPSQPACQGRASVCCSRQPPLPYLLLASSTDLAWEALGRMRLAASLSPQETSRNDRMAAARAPSASPSLPLLFPRCGSARRIWLRKGLCPLKALRVSLSCWVLASVPWPAAVAPGWPAGWPALAPALAAPVGRPGSLPASAPRPRPRLMSRPAAPLKLTCPPPRLAPGAARAPTASAAVAACGSLPTSGARRLQGSYLGQGAGARAAAPGGGRLAEGGEGRAGRV